jgi:hypothetical protein
VQSILSVIFNAIRNSFLANSERGRKLREGEKNKTCGEKKRREKKKKKKGGEIKYNCLKSREGIVIVKFKRILFTLLSFFIKMKRLKSDVFSSFC